MPTFLKEKIDFERHNDTVRRLRQEKNNGVPSRVDCLVSGSITNYFSNPELNTHHYSFEQFFTDMDVHIQAQLEYQHYYLHNWMSDREMGLPDKWYLALDFQNSYEASWVGCPIKYMGGPTLPDTIPIFRERKELLYEMPKLLPLENGVVGLGMEWFERMREWCKKNDFMGREVVPPSGLSGEGSDGVLDLAFKLRGTEETLIDMIEDPEYFHDLLNWITENIIHRIQGLRKWRWEHFSDCPDQGMLKRDIFIADDALALISCDSYIEEVLPYHKRLYDALSVRGEHNRGMHLCGDSTRHFKTIADELGVTLFDTGFPVDHGKLRRELGPNVHINGGPTIMTLKSGTPAQVREETKKILESGVKQGGEFTVIAANNLAPCTPVENIAAMYETTLEYGKL